MPGKIDPFVQRSRGTPEQVGALPTYPSSERNDRFFPCRSAPDVRCSLGESPSTVQTATLNPMHQVGEGDRVENQREMGNRTLPRPSEESGAQRRPSLGYYIVRTSRVFTNAARTGSAAGCKRWPPAARERARARTRSLSAAPSRRSAGGGGCRQLHPSSRAGPSERACPPPSPSARHEENLLRLA